MSAQEAKFQLKLDTVQALYRQMQADRDALQAQLQALKSQPGDVSDLVEQVLPSVVSIHAIDSETQKELAAGSGFFVAPDIIVTNYRIVQDVAEEDSYFEEDESPQVVVRTYEGELRFAEVVFTGNLEEDLALLLISDYIINLQTGEEIEFPQEYPPLELVFDAQVGEAVMAVGYPLREFSSTLTQGMINAIRELEAEQNGSELAEDDEVGAVRVLQTDATINLANAGGPLINTTGQVLGVNVWGWVSLEGINCAIAAEALDDFLAGFEATIEGESEDDFE